MTARYHQRMRSTGCLVVVLAACGGTASGDLDGVDAFVQDTPTVEPSGEVLVVRIGGDSANATAGAGFVDGTDNAVTIGAVGECIVTTAPNPIVTISAGTITITGANNPVTLTPGGEKPSVTYPLVTFASPAENTQLQMSAAGADFPAFTGMGVVPGAIEGFTPPTSLSRSAGYTATWTGAGNDWRFRILVLANPNSTNESYRMTCEVPDSGTYTIPPAAFALFPPATEAVVSVMRYTQSDALDGAARFVVGTTESSADPIPLDS
jgi:hypothetical protein